MSQPAPQPKTAEPGDLRGLIVIGLVAAAAGVLVGIVGGYFRKLLFEADDLRSSFLGWAHQHGLPGWLLLIIVVVVSVAVARLIVLIVPRVSGSGIQDVEGVWRGEIPPPSWQVVPAKFAGGLLAIGAGLALGREGPTVHLGAAIGSEAGKRLRLTDGDVRTLQTALGGAGLGVAFNAPLGGALFVFEEIAKTIRLRLIVTTLIGTSTAIAASRMILGNRPDFLVGAIGTPPAWMLLVFLLFGALTGLVGAWYNQLIMLLLRLSDRMRRVPPFAEAAVIGVVVGILLWFDPLVATGGGDQLTQNLLDSRITLAALAAYFLIRFFLGPLSYAGQTPGGLFSPLLAVGALWGAVAHGVLGHFLAGPGTDVRAFAIVGMSTLFAAIVRAPLTGIVLIIEMTATTSLVVPMLAAAVGAVITTSLIRNPPIYDSLGLRMKRALYGARQTHPEGG
jgi:CIC family chloride channel protein